MSRHFRWIIALLVLAGLLGAWMFIATARRRDFTAWEMNAIAVALARYMDLTAGQFPDSLERLISAGLVQPEPGTRIRVTAQPMPDLGWNTLMPEGGRVDLSGLVIHWGRDVTASPGNVVESRRFAEGLQGVSKGITAALRRYALRKRTGTPGTQPSGPATQTR
jgi:hypothetical protein